ncbi:MAG TPA: hydrogenase maturation protease [Jatrophihabitantaceae bacterium]|jgi:hydrogenase maturation protease
MRTLIAGLGNVFHGDDGFGVEVAARLLTADRPAWTDDVTVRDFGIRGVHLAYELLEGYDLVVIADAVSRGGTPGTLYVIEHQARPDDAPATMLDAHDMAPDEVLALVPALGGTLGRVVVVGCEPGEVAPTMGLSEAVARSVERAARLVVDIVRDASTGAAAPADGTRIGGSA